MLGLPVPLAHNLYAGKMSMTILYLLHILISNTSELKFDTASDY